MLPDLIEPYSFLRVISENLSEQILHLLRTVLHYLFATVKHNIFVAKVLSLFGKGLVLLLDAPVGVYFFIDSMVQKGKERLSM